MNTSERWDEYEKHSRNECISRWTNKTEQSTFDSDIRQDKFVSLSFSTFQSTIYFLLLSSEFEDVKNYFFKLKYHNEMIEHKMQAKW